MNSTSQADRIALFSFNTPQMRAFHITWFAFFLCFFGWFGIAPLMSVVRAEFGLTKAQIGNTVIASVAMTIFARLFIGWLCDRIGPRLAYTGLLVLSAIPVMGIGLAWDYASFLVFRLAIGIVGASFVITQYHTSVMFAPNCVGTANATTAGWGNLGGGITQIVMPLILAALLSLGAGAFWGWRLAMVVPGAALLLAGVAYFFLTQDTPEGNFAELRAAGRWPRPTRKHGEFLAACRDRRAWALFVIYGTCFGVELTVFNVASLYLMDRFHLGLQMAGVVAGLFGSLNLFARTLGGVAGDWAGHRFGLNGRVMLLGATLLAEGIALASFSRMEGLGAAIAALAVFGLFVQMSNGATFSVVPFVNRNALGPVTGIVGAGGNAGAVAAGFLFRAEAVTPQDAFLYLGIAAVMASSLVVWVRFAEGKEPRDAPAGHGLLPERELGLEKAD